MANLTFEQAKHLVVRTGYGPELEKIYRYQQMTRQQAVEDILKAPRDFLTPPPRMRSFQEIRKLRRSKNERDKQKARQYFNQDTFKLKQWSLSQLLTNPNTLQEKMVWFWHNHFTSSHQKSRSTLNLLLDQDISIRRNALGNFGMLLRDMAYDPMMLIYLDGVSNKKGKPNENFARELLELFTVGEGHYTENDIKEIARAFTGWVINRKTSRSRLNKKQADFGTKIVFNQSGNFNSDDILKILLQHPRTAEFIAEKFWKEFISIDTPDKSIVSVWATKFRRSNYDITTLLREVLNSPIFWDTKNRGRLIKSPLDLVVGTLRPLDLEEKNLPLRSISGQLRQMGQNIFTPPNVKGWPGGEFWIDDSTLPVRQQFLRRLIRGSGNQQSDMNNMMSMNKKKKNNNAMPATEIPNLPVAQWESWLLPIASVTPINQKSPRERLQAILLDPAYQLK